MIVSAPGFRCPDVDSWLRLYEEDVSVAERDDLEVHLEGCERCRETFVNLAAQGSLLMRSETADDTSVGRSTFRILDRLILRRDVDGESPPAPLPVGLDASRVPKIEGYSELVEIGRGGTGVVFRANQDALGRPVAIKVLSAVSSIDRTARARVVREALTLARLRHPNILSVHGLGEVDGAPYLVTEWVSGGTLQQRLDAGVLSPKEAASMVRTLARAVGAAHALGIVHRDLKPANVLLSTVEGSVDLPKLADFGLAQCRGDDQGLTEAGMVLGTPSYMAPEQTRLARSCGEVGPLADVHALGAILQALLTGRPPFEADSRWAILLRVARGEPDPIRRLRGDVPRDLETIVARCLNHQPSGRYRSADDLADDLGRFLDGRPVAARPIPWPWRIGKWARRRPARATAVALACLAVAGAGYHGVELSRSFDLLRVEQGRTREALRVANTAKDRSRRALETLTDGAVRRMVDRGSVLNTDDLAFLRKLRDFYQEPEEGDDAQSTEPLKNRREGLTKIASFFKRIGQADDAVATFRVAIGVDDEIVRRDPGDLQAGLRRVETIVSLALLYYEMHRGPDALLWSRKATTECRALAGESVEKRLVLCRVLCEEALIVASAKDGEGGEQLFLEAKEVLDPLKAEKIRADEIYPLAQMIFYNRGLNLRNIGRLDESDGSFREALANAEQAQERFPHAISCREWEIQAWDRLESSQMARERYEEALVLHQHGADALRKLAEAFPERRAPDTTQIIFHLGAGKILAKLGRGDEAEVEFREAVEIGTALVGLKPSDLYGYLCHADGVSVLANLLDKKGKTSEAVELFDRMADLLSLWLKTSAAHYDLHRALDHHLGGSARLHARLGHHARAADRLEQLLPICPETDRPGYLIALARARRAAGDLERARDAAKQVSATSEYGEEAGKILAEISEAQSGH